MKRLVWTFALLFAPLSPVGAWVIRDYTTQIDVRSDGAVIVSETIAADFTGDPHHGIYRDIPFTVRDKFGNRYRIRHEVISVTDAQGAPQQTEISGKSGNLHIRIGDPDVYVQEPRTYVIRYKLVRALRFFNEHAEIYWNPIGPEWEVPIERAQCIVVLPEDVPEGRLQTTSYSGSYGTTSSDVSSDIPNGHTVRFWMSRSINPGESMTIVVGWPKGMIKEPPPMQRARWFIGDNGYFFIPPVFILLLIGLWWSVGRDPDTKKSEVVMYDPPDKLRPAEIGTLIDETVDMRDISATIIDLAVRGYVHITADVQKGFLSTKTDYRFDLTKPYEEVIHDPDLKPFEHELVKAVFNYSQSRWMSSLENHFYVFIPDLKDKLYDSMVRHGYFTHPPDSTRKDYQIGGLLLLAVGVVAAIIIGSQSRGMSIGWGIAIALCGAILALAARTMPRKTPKGRNILIGARGFEEYLSRAERDDIQLQEKLELFEKFLPYAMAFGIASQWARAFEGLQLQPPDWYSGGGVFHPMMFAHDLSSASNSWTQSMVSTPRSEGGGGTGSGFSGGSSGGGGGGGGGGGW